MKLLLTAAALSAATLLASQSQAAVIFETNFNNSTLGSYTNTSTINGGVAPTTDDLLVSMGGTNAVKVVDLGGGNQSLELTSASNDARILGNRSTATNTAWSQISTGTAGNNLLTGSFDFMKLRSVDTNNDQINDAGNGGWQFMLNNGNESSGPDSVVQLEVTSAGAVRAREAPGNVSSSTGLISLGVNYRLSVNLDLSSTLQDTTPIR